MTWWLTWLIFVASFVLLGFVGYHFSVRALRFFTLFFAVIVIGLVTRYGITHRMGGPASFVNSFIRGFNDLSVAFFQLPFGRGVQAPGRIGWLVIIVALVFAYRELEVWAMRWQPPTVDTSALVGDQQVKQPGDAQDGEDQPDQGTADSQRHARLMAELKFRLPAVEVRAPAILPGGTKPSELASIAENSGFSGSGLAAAIIGFFGSLWPNPRRYQVRVWIEQDQRSAAKEHVSGSTRVTVDVENVGTGASVATKTLVAHDYDEAASLVAGYVGRHIFQQDPTAPPWCVGSFDGSDLAGLLLAAQQRVLGRSPEEIAGCRDAQIVILEKCRLDAGVARYELAQLYDLQRYHVKALRLHAINRQDYPRFWRGRYRLGMSLEMVANPAFWPRLGEAADLRESLRLLDLCRVTEDAEKTYDRFLRGELPDPPEAWLPAELRRKLLIAARKELSAVRREFCLPLGIWGMFWHRDERGIRKQYWRLGQRQRFRDGVRVAGLLVDLRQSLLEEEKPGYTRPPVKGRQARIAMNIVAAITDRGAAHVISDPAADLPAPEPLPRRNAKKHAGCPGSAGHHPGRPHTTRRACSPRWRIAPGTTARRSGTLSRASSPACGASLMIPSARWSGHGTGSQLIQISASSKPARRTSPIFSTTRSGETIRRSARSAPSAGAWTRSSRSPSAICSPAGPATWQRPPGSRTSGACGVTRGARRPGPAAPGLPSKPPAIASGRYANPARPAGWPGWRPRSCRSSCRRSRDSPSS